MAATEEHVITSRIRAEELASPAASRRARRSKAGAKGLTVLILTLLAIGCYAISLAPVVWVLISEIFPNSVRSQAIPRSSIRAL